MTRSRTLPLASQVPATATAVILNVQAVAPTADSYLTLYPAGAARPGTSNLNFVAHQQVPNLVVVKLGTGRALSIYNRYGSTRVIVQPVQALTARLVDRCRIERDDIAVTSTHQLHHLLQRLRRRGRGRHGPASLPQLRRSCPPQLPPHRDTMTRRLGR